MERKNLILICVTIIIVVLIACVAMVYLSSAKDTNLSLKDTTIKEGEKLTFNLTDDNGNPLANKNLTVVVNSRNKSKTFNLTTNSKGMANLKMKHDGKFKVNVTFSGELLLSSSNLVKNVVVKEKYVAPAKSFPYYNADIGYYRTTGIQEYDVW